MSILNRYVSATLLKATLLILLIFIGFEVFILMATQLGSLGKGSYTLWQAMIYVLLILPQQTYLLFPVAGLLGMLFGFSWLANHHEMMVMRASGVSAVQILRYAMGAGFCLVIIMMLIGEVVAPKAKLYAEKRKLTAISTGQALKTTSGLWLHQGQNFYHIKMIYSAKHIADVSRYMFVDHQLQSSSFAQEGYYKNGAWQMSHIQESAITPQQVTSSLKPQATWYLAINPRLLKISLSSPAEMSLKQMSEFLKYQKVNHLININDQIAFWQRIFQPLSMLIMMFLALPFVLGPWSRVTTSLRLVLGIMVGFAFYLSNQIFPPLSQLLNMPPVFAALLPPLIFGAAGILLFRRVV